MQSGTFISLILLNGNILSFGKQTILPEVGNYLELQGILWLSEVQLNERPEKWKLYLYLQRY